MRRIWYSGIMPRQARIDAPGALQHIIIRGIERKAIFKNDTDRDDFIHRLGTLLEESETACYAWAFLTNHVHLLLRTGKLPISSVMRRLLTGYALGFNRRHRRHGHLFQNRYKSILCEEDTYLKQLVAYIHLNPLRAGVVNSVQALIAYPFTGHGALMGKNDILWQDTAYVLAIFGKTQKQARKRYADYVSKCAEAGRRNELTGGGLIRSAGGWRAIKDAYTDGIRLTSDERILGSSRFVEKTLARAGEDYDRRMRLKTAGIDLEAVLNVVCARIGIRNEEISSPFRRRKICLARALISYLAVCEMQISGAEVARRMNIDRSSISRAVRRIQRNPELANAGKKLLDKLLKENGLCSRSHKTTTKQRPSIIKEPK
jgi:REP element-mobilizing transposase RayT